MVALHWSILQLQQPFITQDRSRSSGNTASSARCSFSIFDISEHHDLSLRYPFLSTSRRRHRPVEMRLATTATVMTAAASLSEARGPGAPAAAAAIVSAVAALEPLRMSPVRAAVVVAAAAVGVAACHTADAAASLAIAAAESRGS